MRKGIDISYYQGNVDFTKIKQQFDFVIIRIGLGDNFESQDDTMFRTYLKGCQDNNIPYGFYLISYAYRISGNESVDSEIEHTKRLIQGTNPFAVFYDMEIDKTEFLGKNTLTNFAIRYCDAIASLGYKVGVYANKNWFTNFLDYNLLKSKGYLIWLAHYGVNQAGLGCDIWQYSDKGNVDGINTNTTDMNIMYTDILNNSENQKPQSNNDIVYQVYSNKKRAYYPEVINDTDFAGGSKDDDFIGGIRAKFSNRGIINIQSHLLNGTWLSSISSMSYKTNDLKDGNSYSGIYGRAIDGITISSSVPIKYRVYAGGRWWNWCLSTNSNINNWNTGIAGVKGKPITRIQIAKVG